MPVASVLRTPPLPDSGRRGVMRGIRNRVHYDYDQCKLHLWSCARAPLRGKRYLMSPQAKPHTEAGSATPRAWDTRRPGPARLTDQPPARPATPLVEVTVTERRSPTIRRRRLGLELRRRREAAGVTIDYVAERLECSASKISRIETGHSGATPRDV